MKVVTLGDRGKALSYSRDHLRHVDLANTIVGLR